MRIVFFGTPFFACRILEALIASEHTIVAVITNPDRPQGRSKRLVASPVKELAEKNSLKVFQPEKASSPDFQDQLKAFSADLFVVAAYGEILKPHVLETPKIGCINVHGSLLPKYRGAAPVQRCLMAGDKESGVTVMAMEPKMDAGGVLKIIKVPISPDAIAGDLMKELAEKGADALLQVLQEVEKIGLRPKPQPLDGVTLAPKIRPEERLIDWGRSAIEHYNQFRGLSPNPGVFAFVKIQGQEKRILLKKIYPMSRSGKRGEILDSLPNELIVACEKGGALKIEEVQLEGKKTCQTSQFLLGVSKENLKF